MSIGTRPAPHPWQQRPHPPHARRKFRSKTHARPTPTFFFICKPTTDLHCGRPHNPRARAHSRKPLPPGKQAERHILMSWVTGGKWGALTICINDIDVVVNNFISKFPNHTIIGNSIVDDCDRLNLQEDLTKKSHNGPICGKCHLLSTNVTFYMWVQETKNLIMRSTALN